VTFCPISTADVPHPETFCLLRGGSSQRCVVSATLRYFLRQEELLVRSFQIYATPSGVLLVGAHFFRNTDHRTPQVTALALVALRLEMESKPFMD
jgi:hypothetical protein